VCEGVEKWCCESVSSLCVYHSDHVPCVLKMCKKRVVKDVEVDVEEEEGCNVEEGEKFNECEDA
jgi:hypothetical protein